MTEPAKLIAAFVLGFLLAVAIRWVRDETSPDTTKSETWERHYRDPRERKRPA